MVERAQNWAGASVHPYRGGRDNTDSGERDRGAATVWVLAAGLVTVLVAMAATAVGAAIVARHRAQAGADLAALAGAAHAVEGEEVACARAAELVQANGGRMVACHLEGWDLTVSAEVVPASVAALAGTAHASARAGPVEGEAPT
jgi:secretion/DNA translocation related TadE-like protein